ncbi:MAG: response regulator [Vicinamibacterales bacterium]
MALSAGRTLAGRVLVVEDEEMVAAELHARLRQLHLDVIGTEQTARDAVATARRARPDLVLMNASLEGQFDGVEAATIIQRTLDIPVVLLTSRTDPRAIARAKACSPKGCLVRPFRSGDLAISIEMALHRHNLDRQLRQRELQHTAALATIGDGVLATDPMGRMTFMNPVAEVLTGWRAAAATGQPAEHVFQIVDEATREKLPCPIVGALHGERIDDLSGKLLVAGDGGLIPIDSQIAVLRAPDGSVTGAVVAFRDVRQKRLAEHAARRAEDQLRDGQRMQAIGHLAGGVAHDFNNLLTVINGYADALVEMGGWDPRVAKMLTGIRQAGLRSAALTSQLLSFSRKQVPTAQLLAPNTLVAGLIELLQRLIGEDIRLVTKLTPNLGRVRMEPSELEQIMMNLVLNARDAMPGGGRVLIETSAVTFDEDTAASPERIPAGRYFLLSVSDPGIGMDPDVQRRIFEPLFTTKAPGKGTGLGLATVYGIVRKAYGHVVVFSAVDKGTVFKVFLPIVEAEDGAETAAVSAGPDPAGQETVLLVEDDPDVREFAAIAISQFGFKVISASTGLEALVLCESNPDLINVLVTDMVMPVMGGQELATHVRALVPGVKVLFVSGYPGDPLGGAPGARAEAFLQKPFSSGELGRAIRVLLDG